MSRNKISSAAAAGLAAAGIAMAVAAAGSGWEFNGPNGTAPSAAVLAGVYDPPGVTFWGEVRDTVLGVASPGDEPSASFEHNAAKDGFEHPDPVEY